MTKARLSEYVDRAAAGEGVPVTDRGAPRSSAVRCRRGRRPARSLGWTVVGA